MDAVHIKMQEDMDRFELNRYVEIVHCPHAPDDKCSCRKPSPILIENLIEKWNLDYQKCYMVGDKELDALAGKNAKISGALITDQTDKDSLKFRSLLEFAKHIP